MLEKCCIFSLYLWRNYRNIAMGEILDIKTVHQCNCCLGCKTLHPQASVIRFGDTASMRQHSVKFDFYTVLLIDNVGSCCDCCCGHKYYDFSDATMVFLSPEKAFAMAGDHVLPSKGWLLAFHPDLIYGTSLDHTLCNYTFFAYNNEEALHLSLREKNKIECCLENIEDELHYPIDMYSRTIITRHIELLLDYCKRFYERQFITREDKNAALMGQLERFVDAYIGQGKLSGGAFPSAEMCAQQLHLSTQYFNDLLRFSTGKNMREYVEMKRFDAAKQLLTKQGYTPSQVSAALGYQSVQSFSIMFKRLTGVAPHEYRLLGNN